MTSEIIIISSGLTNAYARGAKQNGAIIVEDFPVNDILVDKDCHGNRSIQGVSSLFGSVSTLSLI